MHCAMTLMSLYRKVRTATGERRHGTLTSEAHVIFRNLKVLLESAGSSLDRLVQVHALIYDSIEYDVLNWVYRHAWRTDRLRAPYGRPRSRRASKSRST
jgi:enamine deaminase RidA (YjgF/YER057c/UK114 family)